MANSKGLALVYGAKGTIILKTPAGTALTTGAITTIESYDVTHEADVEQIKNGSGEVVAQVSANERISLSVPAVNGSATIAGTDAITIGGVSIDGDYVYSGGGSVKFTSSGKVMVTITITKYPSLTGTATVYSLTGV